MEIPPPQETAVGTPKEACLSESAVLHFVHRRLEKAQRRNVERHMSRCSECRQLISFVARLELK
jgi:hypothetical protein